MADYIDKRAAIAGLNKTYDKMAGFHPQFYNGYQAAVNRLRSIPAADVATVRNGQRRRTGRILDGFIEVQCSECEETHLFDMIRLETAARYCPYCGVKWEEVLTMAETMFSADALKQEKIKTPFAQMIARKSGLMDGLYYEILYYEPESKQTHIGWGSFNPDYVLGWLDKYFEIDRGQGYSLAVLPFCDDCKYKGVKPTKCSCCRRNLYIKDWYESGGQAPQREDV